MLETITTDPKKQEAAVREALIKQLQIKLADCPPGNPIRLELAGCIMRLEHLPKMMSEGYGHAGMLDTKDGQALLEKPTQSALKLLGITDPQVLLTQTS
jgi:hypothetical protein